MNRLSIRLSKSAHERTTTIIFTDPRQKFIVPIGADRDEWTSARAKARKTLQEHKGQNEQVKNDLGIEFTFKYLGLQTSKHDPDWYGDTWEVTGKGDFKMIYRTGVGHRICFWSGPAANNATAFLVPPSAMDILYSIKLDDPQDASFEWWCENFGFDSDSRKALKTYRTCIEQTMMFRRNYPGVNLHSYEPLENY